MRRDFCYLGSKNGRRRDTFQVTRVVRKCSFALHPMARSHNLGVWLLVMVAIALVAGVAGGATPSQTVTPSGFPVQTLLDNTNNQQITSNTFVYRSLSKFPTWGVDMYFAESDPNCGPGAYSVSTIAVSLSYLGTGSVLPRINVSAWAYDNVTGAAYLVFTASPRTALQNGECLKHGRFGASFELLTWPYHPSSVFSASVGILLFQPHSEHARVSSLCPHPRLGYRECCVERP